jgi:hypothetical protein
MALRERTIRNTAARDSLGPIVRLLRIHLQTPVRPVQAGPLTRAKDTRVLPIKVPGRDTLLRAISALG